MRLTIIGHSTVLIETSAQKILTDPFFSLRGNPVFRRLKPPTRASRTLLDVDLVLVSHLHFDHVDFPYLRALSKETQVLAPLPTGALLRLTGARPLHLMRAWQKFSCDGVSITAVPALHLDVTVGYVIEAEGKTLYFAGDTFYTGALQQIGQRFNLDAALLPVTTFRVPMTLDNAGALKAVQALRPAKVIPIHQSLTGRARLWPRKETASGFKKLVEQAGLPTQVLLLKEGVSTEI